MDWAPLFPKRFNVRFTDQCSDKYFDNAEKLMASNWEGIIWPLIAEADFDSVLELAPGAGRNTMKLAETIESRHLPNMLDLPCQ